MFRQEATSRCTIPWAMRLLLVVSGLSALHQPGCASGGELKWACANDDVRAEQQRIQPCEEPWLYMASDHRNIVSTTSRQVLIVFVRAHELLGHQALQGRDLGTPARPADQGLRACGQHVARHRNRDWTAMLSYITLNVHSCVCFENLLNTRGYLNSTALPVAVWVAVSPANTAPTAAFLARCLDTNVGEVEVPSLTRDCS